MLHKALSLTHTVTLHRDGTYTITCDAKYTIENLLVDTLIRYWRWVVEGKPKDTQHYYDPYKDHMEWEPDTKTYRFRIQIYDSPEGDTWLAGRIKVTGALQIEILEQTQTSN